MNALATLITNGTIAIPILILTLFEALALFLCRRAAARGPGLKAMLPNLLAGDFLLLAWLSGASHQSWRLTAICLLAAFAAHLTDLARRWV
jgi:hypothetical protein